MAELVYSRYIPIETVITKIEERNIEKYKLNGCKVEKLSNDLCLLTEPARLEMIFREGERDYFYNMIGEACRYYMKKRISKKDAYDFMLKFLSGEIEIIIFPDRTYTLEVV